MKKILLSAFLCLSFSFAEEPNLEMFIELDKTECISEDIEYKYISMCETYKQETKDYIYRIKK